MASHTYIKRAMLVIVLVGLFVFEVGLLEGFLPYRSRHAIHQQFERVFPSERYDPHPDMDWEFELDFRQYPSHRIASYALLGILVIGVAYLISKVWQKLRFESIRPPR
jgi:hypothetical protein